MRVLFLVLFIVFPVYLLKFKNSKDSPKIDAVKLKVSAPEREDRLLTLNSSVPTNFNTNELDSTSDNSKEDEFDDDLNDEEFSDSAEEYDELVQVEVSESEERWNKELKEILNRLDPIDGDSIHSDYIEEMDNHRTMLKSLLTEKQQKTSPDADFEIDQLIYQLDEKHQEKLKEILGPHSEVVSELHQEYLDAQSPE